MKSMTRGEDLILMPLVKITPDADRRPVVGTKPVEHQGKMIYP